MGGVDPARGVFVDECGTHTSMTRRRARAPRGSRAVGAVPRNRGPVTTLIAGVGLAGMSPAMTVQGGTDTAVFATYLEHFLLPSLRPGQVVVVDNVGAHQPERIRELVAAAGCQLVFLAAYSPAGLQWVRDNDMRTVLLRHFPELRPAMRGLDNAFAPWQRTA